MADQTRNQGASALLKRNMTGGQEAVAVAAVGVACGLYILRCLPSLLVPSGALSLLATLFLGVLLGIAAAGGLLVYTFYRITHTSPPRLTPLPPSAPTARTGTGAAPAARDPTQPGPTMPHAYTVGGKYSGVLWTAVGSRWDRSRCVLDWPPAGPAFRAWHATLADGTLVLEPLKRRHTHEDPEKKGKKKESGAEEGQAAADGETGGNSREDEGVDVRPPQKVGIPLEGCAVELVREGLGGRSEMVRRAPLLLTHPSWPLLDGEQAIYIFATDPASKQQWLQALSVWCVGGERLRGLEATYTAFCAAAARNSLLPAVTEVPPGADVATAAAHLQQQQDGVGSGRSAQRGGNMVKKASWKRWKQGRSSRGGGRLKDSAAAAAAAALDTSPLGDGAPAVLAVAAATADIAPTESAPANVEPAEAAPAATASAPSPSPPLPSSPPPPSPPSAQHPAAADIDSIIEARWMQSRKVPVPPAPPKQRRSGTASSAGPTPPSSATASPVKASPVVPPLPLATAAIPGLNGTAGGASAAASPRPPVTVAAVPAAATGSAVASPRKPRPSVTASVVDAAWTAPLSSARGGASASRASHPPLSPPPSAAAAPPLSPSRAAAQPLPQQQQEEAATGETLTPRDTGGRLPPGFPSPLLPPDFFVNAAATRVAFDLVRNPAFAEHVRARVQRQLSRMHTPDFVTSLEAIALDPGTAAPSLANFAAVPPPSGDAAWPQLVFDFSYSGTFTVTIECKVDIRDAPGWSALDHAIDKIEGKKAKARRLAASASTAGGAGSSKGQEHRGSSVSGAEESGEESEWENEERRLLKHPSEAGGGGGSSSDGGGDNSPAGSSPRGAAASEGAATSSAREGAPSGSGSSGGGGFKRHLLGQLRTHTAQRLRKLAENTATRISNLPLRVSLTFKVLEGTVGVWIPPPPGDRLFWSFLSPPRLELKATPQLGARLLRYAYHASRASDWIQSRISLSFRKNLVFPAGGDVPLPLLLPLWDPRSLDGLSAPLEGEEEDAEGGGHRDRPAAPQAMPFMEVRLRRP